MDLIDSKTDEEILRSLLAEVAKSKNEIQCAKKDIEKTQSRLDFSLVLINKMIKRQEIKR